MMIIFRRHSTEKSQLNLLIQSQFHFFRNKGWKKSLQNWNEQQKKIIIIVELTTQNIHKKHTEYLCSIWMNNISGQIISFSNRIIKYEMGKGKQNMVNWGSRKHTFENIRYFPATDDPARLRRRIVNLDSVAAYGIWDLWRNRIHRSSTVLGNRIGRSEYRRTTPPGRLCCWRTEETRIIECTESHRPPKRRSIDTRITWINYRQYRK